MIKLNLFVTVRPHVIKDLCLHKEDTVSVLNVNLEKPLEEYGGKAMLLCFRSGLIRASS